MIRYLLVVVLGALLGVSCRTTPTTTAPTLRAPTTSATNTTTTPSPAAQSSSPQILRLATTTSTQDSGLLDAILPDFERQYHTKVDVIAVGTGQALKLGENGDADVVLVHARAREEAFVQAGFGINRRDVMYNDFIIVGPLADPAGIRQYTKAADAFKAIAVKGALFAARGDDSGTATKELSIWASISITPTAELGWYKSLGQGMGETLLFANEQRAYTLTDRGTYVAMHDTLPDLTILVGGATIAENKDRTLLNPYGVIPVNPQKHPGVNAVLAEHFAVWLTSAATQEQIAAFGKERYGQPLFFPGKIP